MILSIGIVRASDDSCNNAAPRAGRPGTAPVFTAALAEVPVTA